MRRWLTGGLLATLLVALALAAAVAWGWRDFTGPGPSASDVQLVLPRGTGLDEIATRLESAGVLRHRWVFVAAARWQGAARELKAGEYLFPAGISAAAVTDLLRQGRTVVRRLSVPEGLTSIEILAQVAAAEGLMGELPALPPEGSLLPETYHYTWGDSRAALLERMRRAMAEVLAEAWAGRRPDLPLATPAEAVVLASIVEKETGIAEERPRVAGVFLNRLRRGMRLQSDPTVAYGVTEGRVPLGRALTRADLELATPFNTYVIGGLPPAPIANPGRASILAVLQPAATDALYFVADGSGGHAFAATLEEHNRNVRRWRRLQRKPPPAPQP